MDEDETRALVDATVRHFTDNEGQIFRVHSTNELVPADKWLYNTDDSYLCKYMIVVCCSWCTTASEIGLHLYIVQVGYSRLVHNNDS